MILGFGILFAFHAAGNLVSAATGLPIPGNVVGMVLLAVALGLKWVRLEWIEQAAQLLVDNLAFLFVPAGVGIMALFGVVAEQWLPTSLSVLVSLIVVLVVTGKTCELVSRPGRRAPSAGDGGSDV